MQQDEARFTKLLEKALKRYKTANNISPNDTDILFNWANVLCFQANSYVQDIMTKSSGYVDGTGAKRKACDTVALFDAGCEKYKQANQLRPEGHEILRNWAVALRSPHLFPLLIGASPLSSSSSPSPVLMYPPSPLSLRSLLTTASSSLYLLLHHVIDTPAERHE